MKKWSRGPWLAALLSIAALTMSCARPNSFVWVQDLPKPAGGEAEMYTIDSGDVLDIRVYNEDRFSGKARVRSDGRVTIAYVGDFEARGKTTAALAQEISRGMQRFLNAPIVTVGVDEGRPITISVVGEAASPGVFTLPPHSGVLDALASAGGLTEFADADAIYVVRRALPERVRFTYHALINNDRAASNFALKSGDVISVE